MNQDRIYMCIDLKSFYASCECVLSGFDPLDEFLVVADMSRTEKTICLAATPALKSFGIPSRARLFEVIEKVKEINKERLYKIKNHQFKGEATSLSEAKTHPEYLINFHAATPKMSYYVSISNKIYSIYLKYFSSSDIHVYSIDEVFIDMTDYLKCLNYTPYELTKKIIKEILYETGITATAGIGTNLYLAKIAMDIVAKHMEAIDDVRIAYLDEDKYKKQLWNHTPLTDFWRVGGGIAKRLNKLGINTMGDICKASLGSDSDYLNEGKLFKEFGVNAELLIDHAWGIETATMEDIKKYRPRNKSLSKGQVLHCAYSFDKAYLVSKEMLEELCLELTKNNLLAKNISLYIGYDSEANKEYLGELEYDHYGRLTPKANHASIELESYTSSFSEILKSFELLFYNVCNENLFVRMINIGAYNFINTFDKIKKIQQLDLFTSYDEIIEKENKEEEKKNKALKNQKAILEIKEKYGKNSILKGMNLENGSTQKKRNEEIGGHKA